MKTEKKCRGIGKALGHGCGQVLPKLWQGQINHQYGLGKSCGCFRNWMKSSEVGREWASNQGLKNVKKIKKEKKKQDNERLNEMRIEVYGPENRSKLNVACQKLARMIDKACGIVTCIDCGKPFGNQTDGGHYHSKGANASIAWNLHNIHSQASDCNQNGIGGGKELGYFEGLGSRYGQEYANYVRYDIVRLYPVIKLSNREVYEKLQLVNGIIKNFETYVVSDPIKSREMFNKVIGIYVKG